MHVNPPFDIPDLPYCIESNKWKNTARSCKSMPLTPELNRCFTSSQYHSHPCINRIHCEFIDWCFCFALLYQDIKIIKEETPRLYLIPFKPYSSKQCFPDIIVNPARIRSCCKSVNDTADLPRSMEIVKGKP